jgi:hypothetical protein
MITNMVKPSILYCYCETEPDPSSTICGADGSFLDHHAPNGTRDDGGRKRARDDTSVCHFERM